VSGFFLDISQKLIRYARDGEKGASPSIACLVLGTVDDDGGHGALRSFRNMERERDIVRRTNEIIFQDITQRIAGKPRTYKSLEAIYSTVANKFCVDSDHVKRVFRLYERDAGSFGLRELLEAATSPPQVFASGLDTTPAIPDEVQSPKSRDRRTENQTISALLKTRIRDRRDRYSTLSAGWDYLRAAAATDHGPLSPIDALLAL